MYELKKHTDWITAIEFSPDGENLVSGDRNGGLIVSDVQSGSENFDLSGHKEMITSVAWRVDGKILGSASKDKTVRIWEMKKGKQVKSWNADGDGLTEICFLPNGNLLTNGREKKVKLWQQDGKQLRAFDGLNDIGMGLAYCGSTARVIAGNLGGEVLVWDRENSTPIGKLNSNPPPISERMIDARQQWSASQQTVVADEVKLQNHEAQTALMLVEASEARSRLQDLGRQVTAAQAKIVSLSKAEGIAREKLQSSQQSPAQDVANGDVDKEKSVPLHHKQQRKRIQAQRRHVKKLVQQKRVLNNQIVACDGEAASIKVRLVSLQKQIERINAAGKPLVAQLEASRAEADRLREVLEYWKAEADFAIKNKQAKRSRH
jgi:hypothetical protein